jgi:hypothetical protein
VRRPAPRAVPSRRCWRNACRAGPIGDKHVRQTHVTVQGPGVVASHCLGRCGLQGRDQPHAVGHKVNVYLQQVRVVVGMSHCQLEKVQADTATPARRHSLREGGEEASGGQWLALPVTRSHVEQVRTYSVRVADIPCHHNEHRARERVLSRPKYPLGWSAHAIAVGTPALEEPVVQDEEAARSGRQRAGGVDRV